MQSFIEQIIHQEEKDNPGKISQTIFIFPNRRPGIFLKKYLSKNTDTAIWSPEVFSIEDFITKHSKLHLADQTGLVMQLYALFSAHSGSDITIDKFFPLGETLLNDFNEIDQQLIDANKLFTNMKELKDIDNQFGFDAEELERLMELWRMFSNKEPRLLEAEFERLWQLMALLYFELKTKLQQANSAYKGMAIKHLIEKSFTSLAPKIKGKRIAVCGFNAISRAEWKLFDKMKEITDLHFYFDTDDFYVKNPIHEAGEFMRKNILRTKNKLSSTPQTYKTTKKNIIHQAVSGNTGMMQLLANDLQNLKSEECNEKTAIILPNEQALDALLEILPSTNSITYNVTMGYPIKSGQTYSFIKNLFELQLSVKFNRSAAFYHKNILNILQHPYIQSYKIPVVHSIQQQIIKNNHIYLNESYLQEKIAHPLLQRIFIAVPNALDVLNYIKTILHQIATSKDSSLVNSNYQTTIENAFYLQLNRLDDLCIQYSPHIDLSGLWKLFRKICISTRVPFEGEPIQGIQIMGFLESRSLDFERVYLLNMNEGQLPKNVHHGSIIPFSIRKAFGMNTFREDDALYAYHFYRLLKRAENIHFYSNTDVDAESKGEPSRYLLQIKTELLPYNSEIKYKEEVVSFNTHFNAIKPFIVEKTDEVLRALSQYEVKPNEQNTRSLTPSSLATYVKSPLQFYFRYVARFKEPDEVNEEMDAIRLGNIVHNTLENLYQPFINKTLNKEIYTHLRKNELKPALTLELKKEMGIDAEELSGRNLLLFKICERLCLNVFKHDENTPGLRLLALEKDEWQHHLTVPTNDGTVIVKLGGKFDRLDEVDGMKRIVDYKTGQIAIPQGNDHSVNIDKLFLDAKFAAALQAYYYSYLYLKNNPKLEIQPVIYSLKRGNDLAIPVWKIPQSLSFFDYFEEQLIDKLVEIWNQELPFSNDDPRKQNKYLMIKPIGLN